MRLQGHLLQLHWLCLTHSYLPKGQVGAEIPPVCRPGFVHPEEGTLWASESLSYPNMQPHPLSLPEVGLMNTWTSSSFSSWNIQEHCVDLLLN